MGEYCEEGVKKVGSQGKIMIKPVAQRVDLKNLTKSVFYFYHMFHTIALDKIEVYVLRSNKCFKWVIYK